MRETQEKGVTAVNMRIKVVLSEREGQRLMLVSVKYADWIMLLMQHLNGSDPSRLKPRLNLGGMEDVGANVEQKTFDFGICRFGNQKKKKKKSISFHPVKF